ncbi:MAG: hypothetical protein ACLTZT_11800 [Butyricimonas faecalis]
MGHPCRPAAPTIHDRGGNRVLSNELGLRPVGVLPDLPVGVDGGIAPRWGTWEGYRLTDSSRLLLYSVEINMIFQFWAGLCRWACR